MPSERMLLVTEIFGPTIQGEGASMGRPAIFLRLWGCNLDCTWCDTKYSWDGDAREQAVQMTAEQIVEKVMMLVPSGSQSYMLVVTGGEPLLHIIALARVFALLRHQPCTWHIEIETNGTVAVPDTISADSRQPGVFWLIDQLNISPKLSNAKLSRPRPLSSTLVDHYKLRDSIARGMKPFDTFFKFVIATPDDVAEVDTIVEKHHIWPEHVFLMPEGVNDTVLTERMSWLVPLALARGYRITPRLHVQIFGNRRGV
jgi:7-carboxy-7-deazaguanine synthase